MADSLSSLPTDNIIPHHNELKVVNELFKNMVILLIRLLVNSKYQ